MNKRRKEQLKIRKMIRHINKQLKEDYFAGRFEIKQTNRKDFAEPNYINYYPKTLTIDNAGDPQWNWSIYTIELIDNEEPERNCKYNFRYSEVFGMIEAIPLTNEGCQYLTPGGISPLWEILNNFIVQSDFQEKHRYFDYAKTHWYSGEELERVIRHLGSAWVSPEELIKVRPERFSLEPLPTKEE